jgi:hypothetical protein
MTLKESSKEQQRDFRNTACRTSTRSAEDRQTRFEFTRLIVLIFMFVAVRGPLFRVEDLTEMGWHRVYVWRAVKSLVKAGILEKFDRKSYGLADDARKWFRTAFGGGVNDAAFAYSTMAVETWSETRLSRFKEKLSEIWKDRPERIKRDPARIGSTTSLSPNEDDYSSLLKLLCEKVQEASCVVSMLEKTTPKSVSKM